MSRAKREREYGDGRVWLPKGGRTYMAAWCVNGDEVRRSTKTTDEVEAHRFLRRMVGAKEEGRPAPARGCMFEEMVLMLRNDYARKGNISWGRVSRAVKHLTEAFGRKHSNDITTERVDAYEAARLRAGVARATVNKELAALRRMFRLALRSRRVHDAPFIETHDPKDARQGFFAREEVYRVAEHLDETMRPLWLFLYETGWRPQDVCGRRPDKAGEVKRGTPLQWSDVDFNDGTVRRAGKETKNGDGRVFPLVPGREAERILREEWERTTALQLATGRVIPWVFHRNGEPVRDYNGPLRRALDAAGLPGRIPYDLRRTARRRLEVGGVGETRAMRLMGHRTAVMSKRYNITTDEDAREALARMHEMEDARAARGRKEARR